LAKRLSGPAAVADFRGKAQQFFEQNPIPGEGEEEQPAGAGVAIPSPKPAAAAPAEPTAEHPPVPGETEPEPRQTPGEPPAPEPSAEEPEPQPEGEPQAVVPDEWAEHEDFEYTHDDGKKYAIRSKKSEAAAVKQALENIDNLRAAMARATHYGARYQGVLEPLIKSGRFEPYAQYIQMAETNPRFAQGVAEIARRAAFNLPMPWEERQVDRAPNGAATEPAVGAEEYLDPYAAQKIRGLEEKLAQYDNRFQSFDSQAQMQQSAANDAKRMMDTIIYEMRARYPSDFDGNLQKEGQELQRIWSEAQRLGYSVWVEQDPYAYPAIVRMTKDLMEAKKAGIPATSVPSVIAQAQATAQDAARNMRSATARAAGGGNATAPAPVQIKPPAPRYADGRRKPPDVFAKELQSYVSKVEAAQR
jgi:hypothetical protein